MSDITFNAAGDNFLAPLDLGQPGSVRSSGNPPPAVSTVQVTLGSRVVARQGWSYPGIDGVHIVKMGVRDRAIQWLVSLRAIDDAELNLIEAQIETYIIDSRGYAMVDQPFRIFTDVILTEFVRIDRRVPIASGELTVRQDGILRFIQQ
ncbi:MAG: hypothetical protein O7B26_11135 [Planctomycetota bacterium]|nr:hypothetical protein [Planctomycetota bacterium]